MKTYKVTVYCESPYGALLPEIHVFRATNLAQLYEILNLKGYNKYFIGSLLEPAIEE
jgi:hypothetical protein